MFVSMKRIDKWNPHEIAVFEAAISVFGKQFHKIADLVIQMNGYDLDSHKDDAGCGSILLDLAFQLALLFMEESATVLYVALFVGTNTVGSPTSCEWSVSLHPGGRITTGETGS